MKFDIAHLSDLHFGNPEIHLSRKNVACALDTVLAQLHGPTSFLVVSGDITFQGKKEGYAEAAETIKSAINRHKLPASHVYVCPGNHDIVKESPYFTSFDAWSARIRNDKVCTFTNAPARLIQHAIGDFLLINTAYHADYKMGLAELSAIDTLLRANSFIDNGVSPRLRIAVLHHHVIPVLPNDISTTRNAHGLIKLLDKYGFSALLHGHQHARLELTVGHGKMLVSGIGSFSYSTPGYINSVAIYRGQGNAIETVDHFGLTLDSPSGLVQLHPTK